MTLPSPRTPSSPSRLPLFLDSIFGYDVFPYAYRFTGSYVRWSALESYGIGHVNVCAYILLITSCFDYVQPTVLIPAYPRSQFTDAAPFCFEGTELLMKGNHIKKSLFGTMLIDRDRVDLGLIET